jgi:hypothetical protein
MLMTNDIQTHLAEAITVAAVSFGPKPANECRSGDAPALAGRNAS